MNSLKEDTILAILQGNLREDELINIIANCEESITQDDKEKIRLGDAMQMIANLPIEDTYSDVMEHIEDMRQEINAESKGFDLEPTNPSPSVKNILLFEDIQNAFHDGERLIIDEITSRLNDIYKKHQISKKPRTTDLLLFEINLKRIAKKCGEKRNEGFQISYQ